MLFYPHAKINLGLHVLRRRDDGFHDIASILIPVEWCDALEFVPAADGRDRFETTGLSIPGQGNFCTDVIRAARLEFELPPLHLHLHKNIPMGAGLGGGSADATFLWRSLNEYFNWGLTSEELMSRVLQHGSDCPFFVMDGAALAEGRGERLTPLEPFLSGAWVVVMHDGIHVSTADAYRALKPADDRPSLMDLVKQPRSEWRAFIENDFERYVFPLHPHLEEQVNAWYDNGAFYAGLTGSGSAIFALFEEEPVAPVVEERSGRRIFQGRLA